MSLWWRHGSTVTHYKATRFRDIFVNKSELKKKKPHTYTCLTSFGVIIIVCDICKSNLVLKLMKLYTENKVNFAFCKFKNKN